MPQFKWYGLSHDGAPLSSTVFARSREHVYAMELPATILMRVASVRPIVRRVHSRRLAFMKNLAELLEGRILVSQGLAVLAQSLADPLFKAIATDLIAQINGGGSLAHAAAQWPELADPQLIAAIELGEKTGALSESIKGYVRLAEMHDELIKSAKRSMAMPLFAGGCALIVVILFMVTILPQYRMLIESLPAGRSIEIPLLMSSFSAKWVVFWGGAIVVGGVLLIRNARLLRASIPALYLYDEALFLTRFATLLSQRYGLADALISASATSSSKEILEWGASAGCAIQAGGAFSCVFRGAPLSQETQSLLVVGERSGDLERWSLKAAVRSRERALYAAKKLSSLVVGLLLLGVGLLIAGVIYALYQPIILLMQAV